MGRHEFVILADDTTSTSELWPTFFKNILIIITPHFTYYSSFFPFLFTTQAAGPPVQILPICMYQFPRPLLDLLLPCKNQTIKGFVSQISQSDS
jgi:hypothetical protein